MIDLTSIATSLFNHRPADFGIRSELAGRHSCDPIKASGQLTRRFVADIACLGAAKERLPPGGLYNRIHFNG